MKTKIVYVVVSDDTDCYLEQTLISVYSIRLYNPDADILLVVDNETAKTIVGHREIIMKYVSHKIVVDIPAEFSKMQKSRILKTTLREHIVGDYLFLDSDTIITGDLSDIDNVLFEIAAVPDKHVALKKHPRYKGITKYAKQIGWNYSPNDYYFNSGVFYVKDTVNTHLFYQDWNRKWREYSTKGINIDQPSLAVINQKYDHLIGELDGIWNCQINENGLPFFMNAKIIHYFASAMQGKRSNPYCFFDKSIYEEIKSNGSVSQKLHDMILCAKSTFNLPCMIIGESDVNFLFTYTYTVYSSSKFLFSMLDRISHFIIVFGRLIKKLRLPIK